MQNTNQLRTGENFIPTESEPCSNNKKGSESNDQIIQDATAAQTKTNKLDTNKKCENKSNILSKLNCQ